MRIVETHSHLNGLEYLCYRKPALWVEIQGAIAAVDCHNLEKKISREKGMIGKELFAPKMMNSALGAEFRKRDWAETRTSYWVTKDVQLIRKTMSLPLEDQKKEIEATGQTPIFSYNQTDFVKDRIAVEVQFGKYSFVAYDLFVKHMAFFR